MRIIFLNTGFSQAGNIFWKFIEEQKNSTHIFCLQEVTPESLKKLTRLLNNHQAIFENSGWIEELKSELGQAIFIDRKVKTSDSGKINLYEKPTNKERIVKYLQFAVVQFGKQDLLIGNVHGKTYPGNKQDTAIRLEQSKRIIDFLKEKKGPKIIGGDFNLMPDTKSVAIIEEGGFRNLIKDFKIKTTRNKLSWEKYGRLQNFADYIFTSPEVKIKSFFVPNIEISDHLPLILDFEV